MLAVGSCDGKGRGSEDEGQGDQEPQEYVFCNRVLQLRNDGSWQYKAGSAISLPELRFSLGRVNTAAQLYNYFNTLEMLTVNDDCAAAWVLPRARLPTSVGATVRDVGSAAVGGASAPAADSSPLAASTG